MREIIKIVMVDKKEKVLDRILCYLLAYHPHNIYQLELKICWICLLILSLSNWPLLLVYNVTQLAYFLDSPSEICIC